MENFRGWTRLEVAVYWLRRLCRFVASLVPRVARSRLAAGTSLFWLPFVLLWEWIVHCWDESA